MIRATLDSGSDSLTGAGRAADGSLLVTVETKNGSSTSALHLLCVLHESPGTPCFVVTSVQGKMDFFELVRNGPIDLVREAVRQGAEINARSAEGLTPLLLASTQRDEGKGEVISALLEAGADVNAVIHSNGSTSLMWASQDADPGAIQALLNAGAKVDARDSSGETALMYAAGSNRDPAAIAVLVKAGADVNARDGSGRTVLMSAARLNPVPDVIRVLGKAGADMSARDKDNAGALIAAAKENRNPEVIKALLDAGADAKVRDRAGKTAFDYARANEQLAGSDVLRQLEKAAK